MTRKVFLEHYILDSQGFLISPEGDMLPTYYNARGNVFSIIGGRYYFFNNLIDGYERPNFRYIKQMKRTKQWKTYVTSNVVDIKDNKLFDSELEAAEHVNILIGKYGLDRIPNAVPSLNNRPQYDFKTKFFNVYLSGSDKVSYLPQEAIEGIKYYTHHPELEGKLRFLVGDNPKGADKHFQYLLREIGFFNVVVCHMGDMPRNKLSDEFESYEVDVPKDTPYKADSEYHLFAYEFMNKMKNEEVKL